MAEQTYYKTGGTWRTVSNIWIKIAGTWKYRAVSKVKVAGTWKTTQAYSALPGATPYVQISGTTGYVPGGGGWTGYLMHKIYTASTPICTHSTSINMTAGSSSCQVYMGLFGIHGAVNCKVTGSCTIRLTIVNPIYGSVSNVVANPLSTNEATKAYLNINLASYDWGLHGTAWRTDDVGTFTVDASTTSYTSHTDC
jgi:hypothetical protein